MPRFRRRRRRREKRGKRPRPRTESGSARRRAGDKGSASMNQCQKGRTNANGGKNGRTRTDARRLCFFRPLNRLNRALLLLLLLHPSSLFLFLPSRETHRKSPELNRPFLGGEIRNRPRPIDRRRQPRCPSLMTTKTKTTRRHQRASRLVQLWVLSMELSV